MMNNGYSLDASSRTTGFAQVALISVIAGLMSSHAVGAEQPVVEVETNSARYEVIESESATSTSGNDSIISEDLSRVQLDQELASIFADFASEQKPLEREFEKVLQDNLWDLYIRS